MKIASIVGLIAGLALLIGLLAWQGIADILALVLTADWKLLLVPLIWLPTLFMNARSWQVLFRTDDRPGFWLTFYAQWLGRAVNTLLPVATIGGEIVKARIVIQAGIDGRHASAATVVDKTVQVITIILWGLTGVSLLAWLALDSAIVMSAAIGLATLGAGTAGFVVVQRAGMFRMAVRSAHMVTKSDFLGGLVDAAGEIDALIVQTYGRWRGFVSANGWRMAALVLQTGEVWLAAYLLGYPIGILEALMIKSLTSTVSDAAFVVPNSYGVQEGAFVVLGAMVGWTPDVALALSLIIRIRELIVDVPGLLAWQHHEGRLWLRRRRAQATQNGGGA